MGRYHHNDCQTPASVSHSPRWLGVNQLRTATALKERRATMVDFPSTVPISKESDDKVWLKACAQML